MDTAQQNHEEDISHHGHVLRPSGDVSIDMDRWIVLRRGDEIRLTAREAAVLEALMERPHAYRQASELARGVSEPGKYPVDEHSIEQTICTLRRKLGESAKDARLLVGQRCLGYALLINERTPVWHLALKRA